MGRRLSSGRGSDDHRYPPKVSLRWPRFEISQNATRALDATGAVCTFSTFKPKYLVFPCLISRCTEKSHVFPFLASSPKSSDGLLMANATTAPTVKLVKAVLHRPLHHAHA